MRPCIQRARRGISEHRIVEVAQDRVGRLASKHVSSAGTCTSIRWSSFITAASSSLVTGTACNNAKICNSRMDIHCTGQLLVCGKRLTCEPFINPLLPLQNSVLRYRWFSSIAHENEPRRWSINSLINLVKNNYEGYNEEHQQQLDDDIAMILLADVQTRLHQQEKMCQTMKQYVETFLHSDRDDRRSTNPNYDRPHTKSQSENKKKNVIRAVNVNLSDIQAWRKSQKDTKTREEEQEYHRVAQRARQALDNLARMHRDTYNLASALVQQQPSSDNEKRSLTVAQRNALNPTMEQIQARHGLTVETLAEVVADVRLLTESRQRPEVQDSALWDDTVNKFLRGRLLVQLLCQHYLAYSKARRLELAGNKHALRLQDQEDQDEYKEQKYGAVTVNCDLHSVVQGAVEEARHVCDAHLGVAPEVGIYIDGTAGEAQSKNVRVTLIRAWVHHALVELLKNALSATVTAAKQDQLSTFPEVRIHIFPPLPQDVDHETDTNSYHVSKNVAICQILDQGTGLPQQHSNKNRTKDLFAFAQSPAMWDRLDHQQSYAAVRAPLSGLGVGLHQSRLMMQLFGGDVELVNRCDGGSDGGDGGGKNGCVASLILQQDRGLEEMRLFNY